MKLFDLGLASAVLLLGRVEADLLRVSRPPISRTVTKSPWLLDLVVTSLGRVARPVLTTEPELLLSVRLKLELRDGGFDLFRRRLSDLPT